MKSFQCTCGNALFFESSRCLACGLDVGYEPVLGLIRRIDTWDERLKPNEKMSDQNRIWSTGSVSQAATISL